MANAWRLHGVAWLAAWLLAACGGGGDGPRVLAQPQAISFAASPALTVGAQAAVLAQASSGLAVVFSSRTPEVCSVEAGTGLVSAQAVGTCTVEANQSGNADWAVAPARQMSLAVQPRVQVLDMAALAPTLAIGSVLPLQAAATSGLAVQFSSLTPATCAVAAADTAAPQLQALAAGDCVVAADQAGDATWAAAPRSSRALQVVRRAQDLGLAPAPVLLVTWSATVRADAASGLPVSYASLTPATCSVDRQSGLVTGLSVGQCTVAAEQPGDATWLPALSATLSLPVDALNQTLRFDTAPVLAMGGTATVRAVATSGLAVGYGSATPAVCSVQASTGVVTGLATGTCSVSADQAGNAEWRSAPQALLSFTVAPKPRQQIAFGAAPALTPGGTASVAAAATSGLPVRYSSLSPLVCAVGADSGVLTGLLAGLCTVAADQAGNAQWQAASQATLAVPVAAATQTIDFPAAEALVAGGTVQLRASATSALPVAYTSLTPGVCSVQAATGLATGLAGGTCRVAADQPGSLAWAAAPTALQDIAVALAAQRITFAAVPSLVAGGSAVLQASATSGLAVGLASQTPAVCSVDSAGGLVSGLAAGTCTVAAGQGGNAAWAAAAPVTLGFAVGRNPVQTIRFGAAPVLSLGGTASVTAVASSGGAVQFSSATPTVCTVQADTGLVTDLALGDCTVVASQAGNDSYAAATPASLTLPVQVPAGVTVPPAPSGVAARLGNDVGSVVVSLASVQSGGSAITGYSVVSTPAGITASASSAPVTVRCPGSCAGYAFALRAHNAVGAGSLSASVQVLTVFDVLTTFHEPDTQPRDTVFSGSFTLNSTTGAISGLAGQLTESMTGNAVGAPPFYDMTRVTLANQLQTWRDGTLGGTFVASFAKTTTRTFTQLAGGDGWSPAAGVANGGVYAGFPASYGSSVQNSSVLVFVPDDPFAPLTAAQLAKLAYADCAPGGMMGAVCMTATSVAGYGAVGTMSGYPVSQVLVRR